MNITGRKSWGRMVQDAKEFEWIFYFGGIRSWPQTNKQLTSKQTNKHANKQTNKQKRQSGRRDIEGFFGRGGVSTCDVTIMCPKQMNDLEEIAWIEELSFISWYNKIMNWTW